MDINSNDFHQSFDPTKATVGIVGQGFVGSAMKAYFDRPVSGRDIKMNVIAYDKFKDTGNTLKDVVEKSQIIFVCVPTPMRKTGECYTGIVESVLEDIVRTAAEVGRSLNTFVVCVKSTVWPGFTKSMQKKFEGMRIVFSPEFLTEKNAVNDMIQSNRVVVGGVADDAAVVLQFFLVQDNRRVNDGSCILLRCDATAAEMVKLYTNGLLFTKVLFSNEIYQLCEKLNVRYEDVRMVSCLDPRIGPSHTMVPGHDGHLGAGGHCFPKDMNNLVYTATQLGVDQKIFTAVLSRNSELRDNKDWEEMSDRAVTDK